MRLSELKAHMHENTGSSYGENWDYGEAFALIKRVEQVVKEMRTTDCDGRDIPRFADQLEGKA